MLFPRRLCSPDDARWHREEAVSAWPGRVQRHSIAGGGGTSTAGWDLVGVTKYLRTRLLWPKWGWDASPLLRWALLFGKRGGQGPGQRHASMHREPAMLVAGLLVSGGHGALREDPGSRPGREVEADEPHAPTTPTTSPKCA